MSETGSSDPAVSSAADSLVAAMEATAVAELQARHEKTLESERAEANRRFLRSLVDVLPVLNAYSGNAEHGWRGAHFRQVGEPAWTADDIWGISVVLATGTRAFLEPGGNGGTGRLRIVNADGSLGADITILADYAQFAPPGSSNVLAVDANSAHQARLSSGRSVSEDLAPDLTGRVLLAMNRVPGTEVPWQRDHVASVVVENGLVNVTFADGTSGRSVFSSLGVRLRAVKDGRSLFTLTDFGLALKQWGLSADDPSLSEAGRRLRLEAAAAYELARPGIEAARAQRVASVVEALSAVPLASLSRSVREVRQLHPYAAEHFQEVSSAEFVQGRQVTLADGVMGYFQRGVLMVSVRPAGGGDDFVKADASVLSDYGRLLASGALAGDADISSESGEPGETVGVSPEGVALREAALRALEAEELVLAKSSAIQNECKSAVVRALHTGNPSGGAWRPEFIAHVSQSSWRGPCSVVLVDGTECVFERELRRADGSRVPARMYTTDSAGVTQPLSTPADYAAFRKLGSFGHQVSKAGPVPGELSLDGPSWHA